MQEESGRDAAEGPSEKSSRSTSKSSDGTLGRAEKELEAASVADVAVVAAAVFAVAPALSSPVVPKFAAAAEETKAGVVKDDVGEKRAERRWTWKGREGEGEREREERKIFIWSR